MSTLANADHPVDAQPGVPRHRRPADIGPVSMARTVLVEVRKIVDTRAGLWMLIVMSAISAVILSLMLIFGEPRETNFALMVTVIWMPLGMLLPILGVIAATAEWTQRTGLVTFTLEPRRGRVLVAKIVAAIVVAAVVMAAAIAAAALAGVIAQSMGAPDVWNLSWAVAGGLALAFVIVVVQGVAFGFALLNTPVAIVSLLALPTVWSVLGFTVEAIGKVAPWLDLNRTTNPLTEGTMSAGDWAHLGTSAALWVLLPMAIGFWRIFRREMK